MEKKQTAPFSGHLKVKKIGEFKKTKSNRSLLSSPTFAPKSGGKKGLLFPGLKKNTTTNICKSAYAPSRKDDDSNSDKSSPEVALKIPPACEKLVKFQKRPILPKKSIDVVKLDTNSDTDSDLTSSDEDSNESTPFL